MSRCIDINDDYLTRSKKASAKISRIWKKKNIDRDTHVYSVWRAFYGIDVVRDNVYCHAGARRNL
jgi:hypothetical protein